MSDQRSPADDSLWSLIEDVFNGEASAEQHRELEQRLLEDEQAREVYLRYANLHSSLRRWFLSADSGEFVQQDLSHSPVLPRDELAEPSTRPVRMRWLGWAVVVGLLCVLGVYQTAWFRGSRVEPIPPGPRILKRVGDVQIQTVHGITEQADERRTVHRGETVITSGDEDRVVLRYEDGTEIVLLGTAALTIQDSPQGGKELQLKRGLLQADVAPQPAKAPLWIVTPHARVRVLGTRFELATDQADGTRLDLESGQVELVRRDERPVAVEPNSIAIVPSNSEPIRVSARPAIVDSPLRETAFRGLRSAAFSGDGQTIVAATRWQAVYWFADDRLEALPVSPHGRDGVNLKCQNGPLLVFEERNPRKLVIWDAQARQPLHEFDNFPELRRQFSKAADQPETWNVPANVVALSPHADWLAFQFGREFRIWRSEEKDWPQFVRNYDGPFTSDLTASPDGQRLAVAVRRGKIEVMDVATGEVTASWPIRQKVPFALDFSADGQRLAVGFAGRVRVYDVTTGEMLVDFTQPGLSFLKVALSADARFVAAATPGERVWIWDITQRTELPLIDVGDQVRDLTFSPRGHQLAVVSRGGRLSVWDVPRESSPIPFSKSETKSK